MLLTTTFGERDSGAGVAAGVDFKLACTNANKSDAEDKFLVRSARVVSSFTGSSTAGDSGFVSSNDFFTISISCRI